MSFKPFHIEAERGQPELALLAAVIRNAVEEACEGDLSARQWLASPMCAACLAIFTEADPLIVQAALIAKLPTGGQLKLELTAA